jgi:hypothetical protein
MNKIKDLRFAYTLISNSDRYRFNARCCPQNHYIRSVKFLDISKVYVDFYDFDEAMEETESYYSRYNFDIKDFIIP